MPAEIFTAEPISAPDASLRVPEEAGIETIFGVPGPVALFYSRTALPGKPLGSESFPFLYKAKHSLPPAPPHTDPARFAAAAQAIRAAKRPVRVTRPDEIAPALKAVLANPAFRDALAPPLGSLSASEEQGMK